MFVHLKHPFIVSTGIVATVAFLCFLDSARAAPVFHSTKLIRQNMLHAQHVVRRPHQHPVVDLTQTVSALQSLNSVETLATFQQVLRQTGTDPRELRQILQHRVAQRARQLGIQQHVLRNSTH
jgi:hypothetical protein